MNIFFKLVTFMFILLTQFSCLPEQQVAVTEDNTSNIDSTDTQTDDITNEVTFPETLNFLQEGTNRTTTSLNLFSDYSDSFLIRGNELHSTLRNLSKTSQSNLCLILHFPNSTGLNAKNVFTVSAKLRSYYSQSFQTKEYLLQVEPNNEVLNKGDCLNTNISNKISSLYNTSNIAYKLEDVCPNCSLTNRSNGIQIFDINANEISNINLAYLSISAIPPIGSDNGSGQICTVNNDCVSSGYNCCLDGQCVNHGSVKPEIDQTSSSYLQAVEILKGNPNLISNFQNFFYVCPVMVPTDGNTDDDSDTTDPIQDANDLFKELTQLYQCTTPIIDEFSICTVEYENASELTKTSTFDFEAGSDDINFSTISTYMTNSNNIVEINYAGLNLYKGKLLSSDVEVSLAQGTLSTPNDNLTTKQYFRTQLTKPTDAANDTLSISYKIDGTCEKLGSSLARCTKKYIQGQISNPPRSSDHAPGDQIFALPIYADTTYNVIVEVGGSTVASGSSTWNLSGKNVVFDSTNFPVFNNQEISITYFVTSNIEELTASKVAAQLKINEHCACDPNEDPCSLKPTTANINGEEKITSYACVYPNNNDGGPLDETVYLSAKTVPHKFYDEFGVNYDFGEISTSNSQEGNKFEYEQGNYLKPSNKDQYIGFNEIYGSMNLDSSSPNPPKVIEVEKGKTYDIFVDEGSFSTCLNCGTDYYSSLQKIFPNNFDFKGGGYQPSLVESRRRTNASAYRADDLRFGRACFVPATMIPWTHKENTDVTTQRRNRLSAQHFLFANGYNKDWYGFDYGSVIGSFDGVKWFAIGNERRIKAESNKLYLAVNAYFGDLTLNNSFKLRVSEMTAIINAGADVLHDTDSDGAQCQKSHYCSNDNDCITQLGYDYICQNVSSLSTQWPSFDSNGNEISGSTLRSLLGLVGGSNGQVKRCVYRGKGSVCATNAQTLTTATSYTNSTEEKLHTCSSNTSCASLSTNNFNTKIARFAQTPLNQNNESSITEKTDRFGLGARIIGRPYRLYGTESVPSDARSQLTSNNVDAICIPGKDPDNTTTVNQANTTISPIGFRQADKVSNVGRTMSSSITKDPYYLALCPATDSDGNYTHFGKTDLNVIEHQAYAINQNISSNILNLPSLSSKSIFNDSTTLMEVMGYQKNTCLRAPGSSCFSDFECAPNNFIATKIKSTSGLNTDINQAEIDFWETDLVCSTGQERYQENSTYQNPFYDIKESKCCRDTGKNFKFYSQPHIGADFSLQTETGEPAIPGVTIDINDSKRYSSTHVIYDKLKTDSTNYPNMIVASPTSTSALSLDFEKLKQYKTLHLHNQRMCCTGHWVRNFASGTNSVGGGHKFLSTTQQNIDISTFKTLSWAPNNDPPINNFPSTPPYTPLAYTCQGVDFQSADCEIKNIIEGSTEEEKYLSWFSKFELIGIPQVLIETNQDIFRPLGDSSIDSSETDQADISSLQKVLPNTIKDINADGKIDVTVNSTNYYSAATYDNFEIGSQKLKKIFSENEFSCCMPTGIQIASDAPNEMCCTGQAATSEEGVRRCCLNDFTDLSVYTNRYVSSEGAQINGQDISDNDIDPTSGYIKKEIVLQMAATMCCSGKAAYGKALGNYFIPIDYDGQIDQTKTRRWLYHQDLDNASEVGGGVTLYQNGLKWNNHVYCVPSDFDESGNDGSTGGGGGAVGE